MGHLKASLALSGPHHTQGRRALPSLGLHSTHGIWSHPQSHREKWRPCMALQCPITNHKAAKTVLSGLSQKDAIRTGKQERSL